jgi:large subunit ribosomal protein L15
MNLSDLRAPKGATKKAKRVGRGESSGMGKTSGRGGKGQKARSGNGKVRLGFEGGQMPMYRRIPKRGFHNVFRDAYAVVNVGDLARFDAGSEVGFAELRGAGLVRSAIGAGVKILGDGELDRALTVKAQRFSKAAREAIEKAGGTAVEVPAKEKPAAAAQ